MIDTQEMAKEFIERRKAFNKSKRLKPGDKYYLNENPHLLFVSYADGRGGMIIDQEELMKLPKSIQAKIFSLHLVK